MWRRLLRGFEPRLVRELQRQQQHASLFCDTVLQADGVSIPVHSCVLAAFSPQLARALSAARILTSGQGRLLQLQSVRAQTLLKLVGLFYSGELQGEGQLEQEEVLAVASWLGIESLLEDNGTGTEDVEVGEDGWRQHMKKICREEDGEPGSRTKGDVDTIDESSWGRGPGDASRRGGAVALCGVIQGSRSHQEVKGGPSESILEDITPAEASTMTLSEDATAAPLSISQPEVSITRNDACSRKGDGEVDRLEARDIAELEAIEQSEGAGKAGERKTMVRRRRGGGHLVGTGNHLRVRERHISKIRLRRQSRAELWEIVSAREQGVPIEPRARYPMVKAGRWNWQSGLQEGRAVVSGGALDMARHPRLCATQTPSRQHAVALRVPEDAIMGLGVFPTLPDKPHQPQNWSPHSAGLPSFSPHCMPDVSMGASSSGGSVLGMMMAPRPQHNMGTADALHTPPLCLSSHNLPFACCKDNTDNSTVFQTSSSLAGASEPHPAQSLACSQTAVGSVQGGNLQSMPTPVPATGLHCSSPRGQSGQSYNFTGPVKQTAKVLCSVVACAPTDLRQAHTMQIPALSLSLRAFSGDKAVPEEPMVPGVSPLESTLNLNVFIAERHYKTLQDPISSRCSHQAPEQAQTTGPSSHHHNATFQGPLRHLAGIRKCLMQSFENEFPNQYTETFLQGSGERTDAIQDGEPEDSEVSGLRDVALLNCYTSNVNISHGFWNNKPFKRTSSCDWQSADANFSRPRNICPSMVNGKFQSPKRQQGLVAFASNQAKLLPPIPTSLCQTDDCNPSGLDGMPNMEEVCIPKCQSPLQIKEVNIEPPELQDQMNVPLKVPVSKARPRFSPSTVGSGHFSSQLLSSSPERQECPLNSMTNVKHFQVPNSLARHSRSQDLSCISPLKNVTVSPSSYQEGSCRKKLNMWHGAMKDIDGRRENDEVNTETRRDSRVKRKLEKPRRREVLRRKKQKVDDTILSPTSITEKLLITETEMPVEPSGGVGGLSADTRLPGQSPGRLLTYFSKIPGDGKSRECCNATRDSKRLYQKVRDKCKRKTAQKVRSSDGEREKVKGSLREMKQDGALVGHLRKGKSGRSTVSLLPPWKLTPIQGSRMSCSSKSKRSDCPAPRSQRELAVMLAENENLGLHTEPEKGCDTLGRKRGLGESNMEAGEELEDVRSENDAVRVGHEEKALGEGERETELRNAKGFDKNAELMETHYHILESVATGNRHEIKDVAREVDERAVEAGMTNGILIRGSGIEMINNRITKIKGKDVRCEEIDKVGGEESKKGRVKYRLETMEQGEEKTLRSYEKCFEEVIGSSSHKGTDSRKQIEEEQGEVDVEVVEMGDGENGCDLGAVDEYPGADHVVYTCTKVISVVEDEEIDTIDISSPPAVLPNLLPRAVQVDLGARESSEEEQEIDVTT